MATAHLVDQDLLLVVVERVEQRLPEALPRNKTEQLQLGRVEEIHKQLRCLRELLEELLVLDEDLKYVICQYARQFFSLRKHARLTRLQPYRQSNYRVQDVFLTTLAHFRQQSTRERI